jgi:hypothetical protein
VKPSFVFSILALLCAILLGSCASSGAGVSQDPVATPRHFLWKVSDSDSHVWILGSIHFADSSFYPLSPYISGAFDESEELAVEINIADDSVAASVAANSLEKGLLPQGRRLNQVIPIALWNSLDSLCAAWNFPSMALMNMRPWLAAMTLSTIAIQRSGIDPAYGIDAVLLDSAALRGMPIVGLETAEEQVGALADTSEGDTLGIYYLENTLKEISNLDSMVTQMSRAWKTGDDSLMVRVLQSEKPDPEKATARDSLMEAESDRRIYKDRNEKMATGIAQFLTENRKVFVVVGTAHLVLDQENVIELLRRRGFKVERF